MTRSQRRRMNRNARKVGLCGAVTAANEHRARKAVAKRTLLGEQAMGSDKGLAKAARMEQKRLRTTEFRSRQNLDGFWDDSQCASIGTYVGV